jgi:DNA-binding protein Fis
MKRVVTYVVPMAESLPAESGALPLDDAEALLGEVLRFDPAQQMPGGATKIEVVVTDEQASRILAAVLEHGSGSDAGIARGINGADPDSSLEVMVRKELEEAEPDAHDLLERIVNRVERQLISQVYSDCDHVKSRAAARLGINRNTLLKKLRQFGAITDEESPEISEPTV